MAASLDFLSSFLLTAAQKGSSFLVEHCHKRSPKSSRILVPHFEKTTALFLCEK